jgi:hypothetical protein
LCVQESCHLSEEEDAFDSEALQDINQLTVTSISQLSLTPGNDPDSMVRMDWFMVVVVVRAMVMVVVI